MACRCGSSIKRLATNALSDAPVAICTIGESVLGVAVTGNGVVYTVGLASGTLYKCDTAATSPVVETVEVIPSWQNPSSCSANRMNMATGPSGGIYIADPCGERMIVHTPS